MANMIPKYPKDFESASFEGYVFNALNKLTDDYYVFHSFATTVVNQENEIFEREIDFVVINRKLGVLAIEVKAGNNIHYENRSWKYSSGREMSHGGPYKQAATAKRTLREKIVNNSNQNIRDLAKKINFYHAVCFPQMSEKNLISQQGLPEEADFKITICADDLIDPNDKIKSIFSLVLPNQKYKDVNEKLGEDQFRLLIEEVFCPHFQILSSPRAKSMALNENMCQLLKEQYRLLDFLEEQPTAVINGAAGTGKTMIAIEKARRHSIRDEKVLFLCYNRLLCDKLNKDYKNSTDDIFNEQYKNVSFMTISKLAYDITGDAKNYDGLEEWLLRFMENEGSFGFKHIIIDEGQDFGLIVQDKKDENNHNNSIIDLLQEIININGGTFYIFYDKYQMIQGGKYSNYQIPDYIQNCDCRLTLTINCRNTKEIATTSFVPIKSTKRNKHKNKSACYWQDPIIPRLHLVNDDNKIVLDQVLSNLVDKGIKDIIILTLNKLENSKYYEYFTKKEKRDNYQYYNYQGILYPVTTCIKFKGLEAEAIVLIDLNKDSFNDKEKLEFYVGASRARTNLDLICNCAPEDYYELAIKIDKNAPKRKNEERMKRVLENIFSVEIV